MSSSTEIGSLSELATSALEVERTLRLGLGSVVGPREDWDYLREKINSLQTQCPNHPGVLAARVRWLELALDSFEEKVVAVAEGGDPLTDPKWVPAFSTWGGNDEIGLIAQHYVIEPFMRRHYLKDSFPRLYQRLVGMYDRLLGLPHLNEKFRSGIGKLASELRQRLLEGRL